MQDDIEPFNPDLSGLERDEWLDEVAALGTDFGFFQELDPRHVASFIDRGETLIVSFEDMDRARASGPRALPLGFEMAVSAGWSVLTLLCDGDSWFRSNRLYGFFDQLIDDGFFDDFEQVIFYGAGPCGYAAASYSVAAPGARVLALQPQATLDPRVTEWDERFLEMRRTSFTDRYGYAPDMLDAARLAHVVYDPRETLDAMHAALFTRRNVVKLRVPSFGRDLERALRDLGRLHDMIEAAAEGDLSTENFARMMRARRDNAGYVMRLLDHIEAKGHLDMAERLCLHAAPRFQVPRFHRRLRQYARIRAEMDAAPEAETDPTD